MWDCKDAHVPQGTGPRPPVRRCRTGGTGDGSGQTPLGQQEDTAVGPGCWGRKGGSELLPPQGTGVKKGSDAALL